MKTAQVIKKPLLNVDSLSWLIPVGLIISTFLILFFSISEQIAGIKVTNAYLLGENRALKTRIEDIEAGKGQKLSLPTDTPGNKSNKVNVLNAVGSVKDLTVVTQKLEVTGKDHWSFGYQSNGQAKMDAANKAGLSEGCDCYVIRYKADDESKIPSFFELLEYNSDKKTVSILGSEYKHVVVFINDKLLMYKDFANNDDKSLKSILESIKSNNQLDPALRDAASKSLNTVK